MQPAARPFFRAAVRALQHAVDHLPGGNPDDSAQVILSLDHMVEMLLKAALAERGQSILKKRRCQWDSGRRLGPSRDYRPSET